MAVTQKPASATHDLLIVERDEPLASKSHETLQRKGFAFRVITDVTDALPMLEGMVEPILVLDAGLKSGCRNFIDYFLQKEQFHDYPVLVLGNDIDGLGEALAERFGLAVTLKQPCSPHDLLEAINYIAKSYKREKAAPKRRFVPPGEAAEKEDEAGPTHPLYSAHETIPGLLFEQIKKFGLSAESIGGANYPKLTRESSLSTEQNLPGNPTIKAAALEVLEHAGRWGSLHLLRCAFIASRILKPLALAPELLEAVRSAVFLFPYSFGRKNRSLLRKPYIGRATIMLRKELCSIIKDSALQVGLNLHLTVEAELVAMVGRLIGREEPVTDAPNSVAASAILAADLTDRFCFQSGSWNPRAGYLLINRIKAGKFREVHPAVLCCLVKFMCEAVTEGPKDVLLPKALRDNPALRAQAQKVKDQQVSDTEEKVAISSLTPGMKLSRPIFAFDGRKVLSEDLILDQDLIWRIWQLSALRPLNAPVVVVAKDEPESEN